MHSKLCIESTQNLYPEKKIPYITTKRLKLTIHKKSIENYIKTNKLKIKKNKQNYSNSISNFTPHLE